MKKLIFVLIILILINASCSFEGNYVDDHFFIYNDGSSMPVLVQGNMESDVLVIFLHGGPGGNAVTASYLPVFQELGEDYMMAYWDQRGSGLSQGNSYEFAYTMEAFIEDLTFLVQTCKERYDSPKIFLYGISWGGALGCAFLSTDTLQNNITGFINMDSGHNLVDGLPLSVDFVEAYADSMIGLAVETEYWTKVRDWCTAEPDMTVPDNYFTYVNYLRNTNATRMDDRPVDNAQIKLDDIFNSYMSFSLFFSGTHLAQNFNILELDLSDQMSAINTPTLVLWGRHDGVNTIEMGYDAYNSIGDSSFTDKSMVILENSAHAGYLEEKEAFQAAFRNFIETYR
jgi:pimeloyl-ACP methyl ester carboxylesterase